MTNSIDFLSKIVHVQGTKAQVEALDNATIQKEMVLALCNDTNPKQLGFFDPVALTWTWIDGAGSGSSGSGGSGSPPVARVISLPLIGTNSLINGSGPEWAIDTSQQNLFRTLWHGNCAATWRIPLEAGTWKVICMGQTNNNRGISTFTLDTTVVGSIDWYSADNASNVLQSSGNFTVPLDGMHDFIITAPTHNGSSSDNYLTFSEIILVQVTSSPTTPAYYQGTVGVRVRNSTGFSIVDAQAGQLLAFDTVRYDPLGMYSSAHPSRLVCKVAGIYNISATVQWASNNNGTCRCLMFRVNSNKFISIDSRPANTNTQTYMSSSTQYQLAVGDYVEVWGYQISGSALAIDVVDAWSPEFMMALS